ncbi:hypothetical protein [Corallococcus sp. AB018]|uniref:hypothetical protein n=1 Tax=Corallococcus sp. AB018 TaxID=2316715 RepID=UPI0013153011|nr:hypothetical protein [Corallococcus sp. AB018]
MQLKEQILALGAAPASVPSAVEVGTIARAVPAASPINNAMPGIARFSRDGFTRPPVSGL